MVIGFQGHYDKATFYKAVRLANTEAGNQKRFQWILFVFSFGALILLIYRAATTADWTGNTLLLGAAVLMTVMVGGLLLQPYFVAHRMWANPGTQRPLKGQVTNRGVEYMLDVGRNEVLWERIQRVRMDERLVALVRDDGLLLVFPSRFFKRDSDWRKFKQLANSKVNGS